MSALRSILPHPSSLSRALPMMLMLAVSLGLPGLPLISPAVVAAPAQQGRRLVVIPFKVLGGTPADAWLGESFAEQLSLALSQARGLSVIERSQLDQLLKEQGLGQSFMADEASAPKLGRLLGAQQLVLGSVQIDGDALVVSLRLVDSATGQLAPMQSLQLQGSRSQLFELQSRLAALALQKWAGLSPEAARAQASALNPTGSAQAYTLYQQALADLRTPSDAKLQAAMQSLRQAIALDPAFTLAYAALSEAHALRASYHYIMPSARPDDMDRALDYAQQALKIGSHPEAVYRALARAQFARGDRAGALASIETALAHKPGDSLSLHAWLEYQPEKVSAEKLQQTLLGFGADPDDPEMLMLLSKLELGQLRRLIKQAARESDPAASAQLAAQVRAQVARIRDKLERVEAQQAQNPYVQVQFAELALQQGNFGEARQILERALAMDPENAMVHFAAGTAFFSTQRKEDADFVISHFRRGLELDPAFAPAHSFWGMYAYFILRDQVQAREHLLAAQQLIPDTALSPMLLGYIALENGEKLQAYAYLRKALENQGKLIGEQISRGSVLISLIQLAAEVKPEERAAWIAQLRKLGREEAGRELRELIDWLAGRQEFSLALEIFNDLNAPGQAPGSSPGQSLSEADQRLYQRVVLLQRLQQSPKDAAVLNDLGRLALLDGQLEDAQRYLIQASELAPEIPTIVFNTGLMWLEQKQPAKAAAAFERVLVLQPQHVKARYQLGEARFRLGQKVEAKALWEALLQQDPGNRDALAALEKLRAQP